MEDAPIESLDDPNPTASEDAAEKPVVPRVARVADYQREALQASDPLEASLGVLNADLFSLAHSMKEALNECLEQPPETVRAMAEFMPAIDGYLRVCKQINGMSQLLIKLQGIHGSLADHQSGKAKKS